MRRVYVIYHRVTLRKGVTACTSGKDVMLVSRRSSVRFRFGSPLLVKNCDSWILIFGAKELYDSLGGRPGLPVPNKPDCFCGRNATLNTVFVTLSLTKN